MVVTLPHTLISASIQAAFLIPELMDHHYKTAHDNELIFTMMGIMAKASKGEGKGEEQWMRIKTIGLSY